MQSSHQQAHRTGPLHQTNKKHKLGKHEGKARAAKEIRSKIVVSKVSLNQRKKDRLNQANQIRKLKRDRVLEEKRKLGTDCQPPLLVGILELDTKTVSQPTVLDLLEQCDDTMTVNKITKRLVKLISPRFKMRYDFLLLDEDNYDETLDLSKTLDILLVSHPTKLDKIHESQLLKTIYVHCLPTTINVVTGLSDAKKAASIKKQSKPTIDDDEKLHQVNKPADALQLLYAISSCKRRKSLFKQTRSTLLVENTMVEENKLKLIGYVRNKTLSPNGLLHVVGWDDYQIEQIDILGDPMPLKKSKDNVMSTATTLVPDAMNQENLDQENEIDPMEGEQTWPTAEELAAEAEERNTKRIIKKLPPGTSEYQGAWIPEEEEIVSGSGTDEDDSDHDEEIEMECSSAVDNSEAGDNNMSDDASEKETVLTEANVTPMDVENYDKNHTAEKEQQILEKIREARMEEMFPDEVDTPLDMPARVRFARFRGLKSFRTSEWDPQENLPPDYSRIYQFQNFHQTRKRILDEDIDNGAQPGEYVCVHLKNVPKPMIDYFEINHDQPAVAVGLLKYERKMTVLNIVMKKVPNCPLKEPIKSKDELIFYAGFRKFKARPLFTNHGLSNKFKYELFFRDDAAMVATLYAPITFSPAPVLVYKMMDSGEKILVATGSVLDSNPSRLIIKRIRLSGHPFKIYSKNAVLRFMFFNAEDVLYFKPVELTTKHNRRGHITEPIGTHGHMKCFFDKKIKSDDCIFMNLYKRVYPKWTYSPISNLTS